MNELPEIGSLFIREGFWVYPGTKITSPCTKLYGGNLFQRPKNHFGERSKLFSTQFYQEFIWAMLIRGKCKFLFE